MLEKQEPGLANKGNKRKEGLRTSSHRGAGCRPGWGAGGWRGGGAGETPWAPQAGERDLQREGQTHQVWDRPPPGAVSVSSSVR